MSKTVQVVPNQTSKPIEKALDGAQTVHFVESGTFKPTFKFPGTNAHFKQLEGMANFEVESMVYYKDSNLETIGMTFKFKSNDTEVSYGNVNEVQGVHQYKKDFTRKVKGIKMDEHGEHSTYGPYRNFDFLDDKSEEITGFTHCTNAYPKSQPSKTVMFPAGFELIGFAVETNSDGTFKTFGFTIWSPPKCSK